MERFPAIEYPGNVPGILYEPRAVWSIETIETEIQPNGRIIFPRNDFQNPGKYPIVLTKVLLAPVNYIYEEATNGVDPPTAANEYHIDGISALSTAQILINAPQRQNYSRTVIPLTSWPALPRWGPTSRGVDDGTGTEVNYRSSLWGVTRWDFEHPMIIPKLGTLEIQLSSFNYALGNPQASDLREVNFAIGVNEGPPAGSSGPGRNAAFPGNMRVHPRSILRYLEEKSPLRTSGQGGLGAGAQSQQRQVFFFIPEAVGGPLTTLNQWPPDQQLSAREYDAQNVTEQGSTPVNGFAVHIDQIDYDDDTVNTFGPLTASPSDQPISPLAMRVATRARMRNGGSGEWWWRPGAPLALVQPTITPALVYQLPTPITLAPGDTLDVELQVQRPITIGINTIAQKYNLGLSLCGYAAIEG